MHSYYNDNAYCDCNLFYLIHSIYVPFCVGVVLKFEEIRVIGVNFDQGKRNLVRVSGVFELSDFELTE